MSESTTVGASSQLYEQWVAAILNRSPEAWDTLIDTFGQRLRQDIAISLRRWGLPLSMSEDVEQETWLRALRNIHKFIWQDEERFYHWLRVIASKCVYEFRRDYQRIALLEDFDDPSLSAELDDLLARFGLPAGNLEDEVILRERMAALDQVLRTLKPEAREIYVRWLMGERPRTLAAIYGKKVGTIAQLLQRTSKKVEAHLRSTSDASNKDNADE